MQAAASRHSAHRQAAGNAARPLQEGHLLRRKASFCLQLSWARVKLAACCRLAAGEPLGWPVVVGQGGLSSEAACAAASRLVNSARSRGAKYDTNSASEWGAGQWLGRAWCAVAGRWQLASGAPPRSGSRLEGEKHAFALVRRP